MHYTLTPRGERYCLSHAARTQRSPYRAAGPFPVPDASPAALARWRAQQRAVLQERFPTIWRMLTGRATS